MCRQKLIETPYARLIQDYQTCNTNAQTAFIDQFGISLGNMGLVTPLLVVVTMIILYTYQECCGKRILEAGYSADDKAEALEAFATALLLAKDRLEVKELSDNQSGSALSTLSRKEKHQKEVEDLLLQLAKEISKHEDLYDDPNKLYVDIEMLRQQRLYLKAKALREEMPQEISMVALSSPIAVEEGSTTTTTTSNNNNDKNDNKTENPLHDAENDSTVTTK